jgi:hypothetical protein
MVFCMLPVKAVGFLNKSYINIDRCERKQVLMDEIDIGGEKERMSVRLSSDSRWFRNQDSITLPELLHCIAIIP